MMTSASNNLYNNRSGGWGKITAKASTDTDDNIASIRVHSPPEFSVNGNYYDVEVQIIGSSHTLLVYFDTSAGTDENDFLKDVLDAVASEGGIDLEDAVDGYETIGKFYQFTSTSTVNCGTAMTYIYWPRI